MNHRKHADFDSTIPSRYSAQHIVLLTALIASIVGSGCASYRSTIMSRLPNDSFVRNSQQHVRGIPVTLKVPTHVDVRIIEEYFIVQSDEETTIPDIGRSLRRVEMETVYTPKVLTVDIARPAAGTLNIAGTNEKDGIILDEAGYFETIQAKLDDQTIEDLNAAIPNFKKLLATASSRNAHEVAAKGKNTQLNKWHSYDTLIAVKRFDIDTPNWESDVDNFVAEHLHCQEKICDPTSLGACVSGGGADVDRWETSIHAR